MPVALICLLGALLYYFGCFAVLRCISSTQGNMKPWEWHHPLTHGWVYRLVTTILIFGGFYANHLYNPLPPLW